MITCKGCGAQGPDNTEDPNDPCPGLCPGCLESSLQELGAAIEAGAVQTPTQLSAALSTIGITNKWIEHYMAEFQ